MFKMEVKLLNKLLYYKIISDNEIEIYRFGLECLVLKLLHSISYLCIAAYLSMLPELVVIACTLIPLRRNAGGYHSRSKVRCYFFSCCYIIVILLIYKVIVNPIIWWGLLAASNIIIFIMSPADNEKRRLDDKEFKYYKRKARMILVLANAGCVLLTVMNFNRIGGLLSCGIFSEALLLILNMISEKFNEIFNKNISVEKNIH